MARAALGLSTRQVADAIGVSHQSVWKAERGSSEPTLAKLEPFYSRTHDIVFGPRHSVSPGHDVFAESKYYTLAALKIATNHGCGSRDIADAHAQAKQEIEEMKQ